MRAVAAMEGEAWLVFARVDNGYTETLSAGSGLTGQGRSLSDASGASAMWSA